MRGTWLLAGLVGCSGPDPDDDTNGFIPNPDGVVDTDDTVIPTPVPSNLAVVINEVMPSNESTIDAPDGTKPDWVELVNVGQDDVDLSELKLRNEDGDLWQGPEGQVLGAGERLLLWADEGSYTTDLSTGFTIDKDGDKLTLLDDQDLVIDYVDLDAIEEDLSWSRAPDGEGEMVMTAWPTPNAENHEIASPTLNVANETFFLPYVMHLVEFTMSNAAFQNLSDGNRPEVHTAVSVDGVAYDDVGLKLKGSASYQDMSGKPAFIVDLNNWVTGTKYRGLKAFKLHNGVVLDPTRNRDYLTYQLAREAGLMAPRVGWAEVYVNGEYYGLYIIVEKHDDEFIEYHQPGQQDIGVILEPNEAQGGGWGGGDFGSGAVTSWNYEEGPIPPDPLAMESLVQADSLIGGNASDERVAELWNYFDKEQLHTYMAFETLVMHTDGYRAPNNWRVFVDGLTYKIQLVPSGVEWTWDFDVEPWYFGGSAASWCISNPGCKREYAEQVLVVADLVEALDLYTQFLDMQLWLDPYIEADPRYQGAWESLSDQRASTTQHLQENPDRARNLVYQTYPDLAP